MWIFLIGILDLVIKVRLDFSALRLPLNPQKSCPDLITLGASAARRSDAAEQELPNLATLTTKDLGAPLNRHDTADSPRFPFTSEPSTTSRGPRHQLAVLTIRRRPWNSGASIAMSTIQLR